MAHRKQFVDSWETKHDFKITITVPAQEPSDQLIRSSKIRDAKPVIFKLQPGEAHGRRTVATVLLSFSIPGFVHFAYASCWDYGNSF